MEVKHRLVCGKEFMKSSVDATEERENDKTDENEWNAHDFYNRDYVFSWMRTWLEFNWLSGTGLVSDASSGTLSGSGPLGDVQGPPASLMFLNYKNKILSYEKKIMKLFINHKSYKVIFFYLFSCLLFYFTVFFCALLRSALRLTAISEPTRWLTRKLLLNFLHSSSCLVYIQGKILFSHFTHGFSINSAAGI